MHKLQTTLVSRCNPIDLLNLFKHSLRIPFYLALFTGHPCPYMYVDGQLLILHLVLK